MEAGNLRLKITAQLHGGNKKDHHTRGRVDSRMSMAL